MVTLHQNGTRIGTITSEMRETFPKWESDQQSRKKKKNVWWNKGAIYIEGVNTLFSDKGEEVCLLVSESELPFAGIITVLR